LPFAVIVSFPLVDEPTVAFLAWTTTPWTLPSNLALCVNPDFDYVKVKDNSNGNVYYMLGSRTSALFKDPSEFTILETVKGKDLEGKKYTPLFDFFQARYPTAYRIVVDTYVTDDSGTGIVHQAPAFGEDDFRVCVREGITTAKDVPCPVDDSGRFMDPVTEWKGQHVKEADPAIMKKLKELGRLVHRSTLNHSYPFCWRSDTPLIYKAVPSWFVAVTELRDRLLKNNAETYWVPDFVKEKRFVSDLFSNFWLGTVP
jgi:isoleucyl-tRNA synthetase